MRSDSSWLSPFIGILKWNADVSSNDKLDTDHEWREISL